MHPDCYNSSSLFMASCLATDSQLLRSLWKEIFPWLLPTYILLPVRAPQQSLAIFFAMSSTCLWGHRSCFPQLLLRHSFCNTALTHTHVGHSPPALLGMCGDSSAGQPAQVSAMLHLQQAKGSEIWALPSIVALHSLYRDAFQMALGWCTIPLPKGPLCQTGYNHPLFLKHKSCWKKCTHGTSCTAPSLSLPGDGSPVLETTAASGEGLLGKAMGKKGDKTQKIKVRFAAAYKRTPQNCANRAVAQQGFPMSKAYGNFVGHFDQHTEFWPSCGAATQPKPFWLVREPSPWGAEGCWHLAPGCCTSFIQQDICNLTVPSLSAVMSFEWKHIVKNCWFTPFENTEIYKIFFYMKKISSQRGKSCSPVLQCQLESGLLPVKQ